MFDTAIINARFDVSTVMNVEIEICVVTCSEGIAVSDVRAASIFRVHMEAAWTSETVISYNITTQH
jgi:hypothetical protein